MILHLYFARRFLFTFLGICAVFFLIMVFADLVEQLRKFARVDPTFADILILTLLNIPQALYQIMPLIMILAAVTLFISLARSSELVVTRAAGRSALRALQAPVITALLIGAFLVMVMNPIVAATSKEYEARGSDLRGNNSILTVGTSGIWLRQGDENGQTVIRARRANLDGTTLRDVTFVSFDARGTPVRRIDADRAMLTDTDWTAIRAKEWPLIGDAIPEAAAQQYDRLSIPTNLTSDEIRDSFGTPSSIPIWEIPAFIDRLQNAGFSAQRHLVWFHSELALPSFLAAMVLIGANFTMRHQRGGRTGLMVLYAVMLAFFTYFIRNFTLVLGENGQLPALLAAWAPPIAAILLSLGFLLHSEDG